MTDDAPQDEIPARRRRLLRNPAIVGPAIVALIGGIFGIVIALIQTGILDQPATPVVDDPGRPESFDFATEPVSARLTEIMRALEYRIEGTPHLPTRLKAIAALSVTSNEAPPAAFYSQAVDILITYIKLNIDARRGPGPYVEEDRGTYRPKDIVDAIAALQVIRRASAGPVPIELTNIDFRKINLVKLDLEGFNLSFSDFGHAFLSGCKCRGANFSFAKFNGAAIWNAHFREVNFHKAELAGSKWAGTDFTRSNIEEAFGHDRAALWDPVGLSPAQRALFPKS